MRPLFIFVHLTKRTKFLVRVRSFIKRMNTNKLPAERFTNSSLNVWFICSPRKMGGSSIWVTGQNRFCCPKHFACLQITSVDWQKKRFRYKSYIISIVI
ncbi:hypothetical protein Hanom_Chr13g01190341 [Helianthus anomalus]